MAKDVIKNKIIMTLKNDNIFIIYKRNSNNLYIIIEENFIKYAKNFILLHFFGIWIIIPSYPKLH